MAGLLQRIAGRFGIGEEEAERPTTNLTEWLDATLEAEFGIKDVQRDEDGDIPLPFGSSVLFIREGDEDSPFLTVFAPLLTNFRLSPAVYEAVNSINRKIPLAKVVVNEDTKQIVMSIELPIIHPLSPDNLRLALDIVATQADHFDTLLQKRFGGNTLLDDDHDEFDV